MKVARLKYKLRFNILDLKSTLIRVT